MVEWRISGTMSVDEDADLRDLMLTSARCAPKDLYAVAIAMKW